MTLEMCFMIRRIYYTKMPPVGKKLKVAPYYGAKGEIAAVQGEIPSLKIYEYKHFGLSIFFC